MVPAPESPSAPLPPPTPLLENTFHTSHNNPTASPNLETTTATTAAAITGILCSVCSAPISIKPTPKSTKKAISATTATPSSGPAGDAVRCESVDGVTSDESSDGELPPPADPDAPTGVNGNKISKNKVLMDIGEEMEMKDEKKDKELINLMDMGENQKEKEEKKERADKLEYKRLDELYNKNIHDFYLAESNAQSLRKDDKWEEYLFIIRRRFDWQNKYQKTFVDVKSEQLRETLKDVLDGIAGISLVEDKPTVEPNLLFNYLPELEAFLAEQEAAETPDEKTISHLRVLIEYIQTDYADIQKRLFPLLANSEVTFDLLWALFLPNSLLFTVDPGSGEDRVIKLDWAELRVTCNQGRFFHLDCRYVDYDGKAFGEANCALEIPEFRGVRKIDQLGVYPLQYHVNEESVRSKLVERGKKFVELKGMHYRMYRGVAFFKRKKGFVKVNINGRVMVDPSTFRRINPNYRLAPVKDFGIPGGKKSRGDDNDDGDDDCCGGGGCEHDDDDDDDFNSVVPPVTSSRSKSSLRSVIAARRRYAIDALGKVRLVNSGIDKILPQTATTTNGEAQSDGELNPENMTNEDLLLCSPTVLGFSFADKLWVELAVARISDIQWDTGAFDSLVLPEAQKRIVRALVESHTNIHDKNSAGFDDFIKGKGRGLVAVLHGRPGVGKTLTAEGISEFLKRPLYCVSAGELGTDPKTLEQQLSKILDIAHVWGAVLLLDEADVFLERRSVHDLHRNALVSIFLRLLEYFQGILFLTTNRVETFDEAFQSRIHIALRYSDLDRKAKKQIWCSFLNIVARDEAQVAKTVNEEEVPLREVVTDEELENLARRELNGRQIKNVVRTSQALAQNRGEKLGMVHLREVLEVTEGFERDFKGTGQLEGMMSYA